MRQNGRHSPGNAAGIPCRLNASITGFRSETVRSRGTYDMRPITIELHVDGVLKHPTVTFRT